VSTASYQLPRPHTHPGAPVCSAIIAPQREERKLPAAIPNMKPAKAGQPYSAAINHVIVGQVLHSPALNEGHVQPTIFGIAELPDSEDTFVRRVIKH